MRWQISSWESFRNVFHVCPRHLNCQIYCTKLFLILPYNPVNIYRTHTKLISLTPDTCNVWLHSFLPGQSDESYGHSQRTHFWLYWASIDFSVFYNFCSYLYVHSSAKSGFHLLLFIKFPEMEAEVTALRPFFFFLWQAPSAITLPWTHCSGVPQLSTSLVFIFSQFRILSDFPFDFLCDPWLMEMCYLCSRLSFWNRFQFDAIEVRKHTCMNPFIFRDLLYGPACGLPWQVCCEHLRRACLLLFWVECL